MQDQTISQVERTFPNNQVFHALQKQFSSIAANLPIRFFINGVRYEDSFDLKTFSESIQNYLAT
jgi:hypothetical protein